MSKYSLEECMAWMDVRAEYIAEHQSRMFDMFKTWSTEDWSTVIDKLEDLIKFIQDNSRMFPNRREHIEQYEIVLEIAKRRLEWDKASG